MRNAIHAFEQEGLDCLKRESSRPKTVQAQFDQAKCEALRALLHQRPHVFGKATSLWTLDLASVVCFEQGLTVNQVSIETIRQALKRLGVGWQRAKHWITSPDPDYLRKKRRRDALIALAKRSGWGVGYQDEVWWSRVSQPNLLKPGARRTSRCVCRNEASTRTPLIRKRSPATGCLRPRVVACISASCRAAP